MTDETTLAATVSASAFTLVVFGGGLIGSRLITLAERASQLQHERADLVNDLSSAQELRRNWDIRVRRDGLADIHRIVQRLRESATPPILCAFLVGVAGLLPLMGTLKSNQIYAVILILGLVVATFLWIRFLGGLMTDVMRTTQSAFLERESDRQRATATGAGYLVSGDPRTLAENIGKVEHAVMQPSPFRHPIRSWRQHRRIRDVLDERNKA